MCNESQNSKVVDFSVPTWKKVTLTIREAAEYSNIGINKLEKMLNEPMCDFVLYVGKKRLIKCEKFELYLKRMIEV